MVDTEREWKEEISFARNFNCPLNDSDFMGKIMIFC